MMCVHLYGKRTVCTCKNMQQIIPVMHSMHRGHFKLIFSRPDTKIAKKLTVQYTVGSYCVFSEISQFLNICYKASIENLERKVLFLFVLAGCSQAEPSISTSKNILRPTVSVSALLKSSLVKSPSANYC